MANELLALAVLAWLAGGGLALSGRGLGVARALLAAGTLCGIGAAVAILPAGSPTVTLPLSLAGEPFGFRMAPDALWLLGFGLAPAGCALALAPPKLGGRGGWLVGTALSLLGALGVFGLQNGGGLLIAWEVMSLGGAVMILSERETPTASNGVLFMLGLLEVGAVALLLGVLILGAGANSLAFAGLERAGAGLSVLGGLGVGVLLLAGFGAKLGLAPFYEWFPAAYGAGSGATGAVLSGVVLNAAFFALARGLLDWLGWPGSGGLGMLVVALGVVSAMLAALYAFQQNDWRMLLSLSSAENAAISVACLGAALIFRAADLPALGGLSWSVALLLLAGHALAKGALFLAADGVRGATGSYRIRQAPMLRHGGLGFGVGALFAVMSLAAMPPSPGFVSEWFVFQTMFQGFHLPALGGRLVLTLAGAGLALTAAVAFATFIKVFGLGLLGAAHPLTAPLRTGVKVAVGLLGALLLALAAGMPLWLGALGSTVAARFGVDAPALMHTGPLLVPLSAQFAFISPSLLLVVMPALFLLPLAALLLSRRGMRLRRVPVWYGGSTPEAARTATTALTFANALRTVYGFVYRPGAATERETALRTYFITRIRFRHHVAPLFGPWLFAPPVRLVHKLSARLRLLQSGQLNAYLGFIGLLFVLILCLVTAGL
jgi:formate hydrogenlyase subunit 3/multisubunit Na+/H+ antiporter MnhD subunit